MSAENPATGLSQASRGVGASDVAIVADALLREGLRPTIERIRGRLGRGSPNTITPLLDDWWKSLSRRIAGGPDLLERMPPEVFHAFEALWVRIRIAAEQRAATALAPERAEIARTAQRVEVKSEVLTLREAEYQEQLQRRAQRIAQLEIELGEAQRQRALGDARAASRERRVSTLERELAEWQGQFVRNLARVAGRRKQFVKPRSRKKATAKPRGRTARKK
jgi:hypothetical protein